MKILFIGDIFGKLGIEAIKKHLSKIKHQYGVDFVIANAENTTNCRGLNIHDYHELINIGIDFITMGNHTWKQKDYIDVLNQDKIIRPFNIIMTDNADYALYGIGSKIIMHNNKRIRITNLLGSSLNMNFVTNPFNAMDLILNTNNKVDIDIVDFHAETTSEKNSFFVYFKSRVSSIFGTHTHVQTNDSIIKDNTSYITDVGMTGPCDGIIGAKPDTIVSMFIGESERFRLTEASGSSQFCAVIVEYDDKTNKPININNIYLRD